MSSGAKPIIFNDEMVKAILEGRKTQTRRIVRPQPEEGIQHTPFAPCGVLNGKGDPLVCRFGLRGDRLWVRENYRVYYGGGFENVDGGNRERFESFGLEFQAGQPREIDFNFFNGVPTETTEATYGRIDYEQILRLSESGNDGFRPSIHMPRWASRITLEITGVRVERLQDVSAEDARAEGCEKPDLPPEVRGVAGDFVAGERTTFAILWNRINGPGAWAANPWVWVIEFRRVDQEAEAV